MQIGDKIKYIRTKKNITRAQLASIIHKSEYMIKRYENGYSEINLPTLFDIAQALDVSVISLIVDDTDEVLNVIVDYYNLSTDNYMLEHDFKLMMEILVKRYGKLKP